MESNTLNNYSPNEIESNLYSLWLKNKLFDTNDDSPNPAYSILMPPPNVTGILHFGHVLNITIQDVYIRWKRMQGYESCWFPGTDHAGIATQTRVEKELKNQGLTRYDLGREKFVEKVWEWRNEYGSIIFEQMRKLGISPDWNRTLFTMDESASNAVRDVFIKLFDEGLIYKGKKIINWSPLAQTALSDEEVEYREIREHLYTLKYKLVDSEDYLLVATVRPETIFGDVAVAVNPNDERYRHLIGKKAIVPLVGRQVPIIADDYADPTFGTGCVKITPAHDPNDFIVGQRHNLPQPNTINPDGTLNELTGEFNGLDRFVARKQIVKKLEELGLIEKIEDYVHNVGYSQRGGEPVEPYLSDQWFVDMKPLAQEALKVVLNGEIKFYPNHWVKTYEHWMTNIRDWCISRQLWWGHRIPVYYSEDGRYTAARSESEARIKMGLPADATLTQDPDVLDTWFSSWLWPLTTMRWSMDEGFNKTMQKFLPTDLLVTAPDIIFFWVARMIMATLKFAGVIPFRDVYFTSTIRDGKGRKLSKSLGNSPDPLNIIDKYGADAVRFTTLYLSPLGQDIRMDVDVVSQDIPSMEIGRNFANKIWNAARFLQLKFNSLENQQINLNIDIDKLTSADKWILSRLNNVIQKVNDSLTNYRLNDFAKVLYDFVWKDFCDWYVEIVKIRFNQISNENDKNHLLNFAYYVFEKILKILHPLMPFITEELWHKLFNKDTDESISKSDFPSYNPEFTFDNIESNFQLMQMVVEEIRSLRASMSIPPSLRLPIIVRLHDDELTKIFQENQPALEDLAKSNNFLINSSDISPKSVTSVVRNIEIYIELDQNFDLNQEISRLKKEETRLMSNINSTNKKLSNSKFVENADPEVVRYEREKLENMQNSLQKVQRNLQNLEKLI